MKIDNLFKNESIVLSAETHQEVQWDYGICRHCDVFLVSQKRIEQDVPALIKEELEKQCAQPVYVDIDYETGRVRIGRITIVETVGGMALATSSDYLFARR